MNDAPGGGVMDREGNEGGGGGARRTYGVLAKSAGRLKIGWSVGWSVG